MDSEEIEKWDEESERAWKNDTHDVEFPAVIVTLLQKILPPKALILDAGCGIGKHVKAFRKLDFYVIGIDQSEKAVKYAQRLNPEASIHHMRIQDITYADEFSLIHTCAVLQHSNHERKKQILALFFKALKPRGYLLCTECTFTLETLKLLKQKNPIVELTDEWTDGYSFSEKGWITFMAENGFQHIKTIPPWPYYLFQKASYIDLIRR